MQEDPIYYRKLADLFKETIESYHQKRIDEAEYLKQVQEYEDKFFNGRSDGAPEELADNEVALAFYNFSKNVFDDVELLKGKLHIEISLAIDNTIKTHIHLNDVKVVEWHKNQDITGKINIELGDVVYDLFQQYELEINWDDIDHLIEECLKIVIAILKYK